MTSLFFSIFSLYTESLCLKKKMDEKEDQKAKITQITHQIYLFGFGWRRAAGRGNRGRTQRGILLQQATLIQTVLMRRVGGTSSGRWWILWWACANQTQIRHGRWLLVMLNATMLKHVVPHWTHLLPDCRRSSRHRFPGSETRAKHTFIY